MHRIEKSIVVKRSPETVFAFMSVAANHARFIPNMVDFRQTSPGAFGQPGSTMRGTLRMMGWELQVPYALVEFEPISKMAMQGLMGPILFEDGYVFERVDGSSTRILFWLELGPTGVARLASPLMGFIGRTHANETRANLKRVLETTG